ncbi:ricin-type beta-trefoil lectin domain protein [Streptomyces sp. NPDC001027]|uniref:ricin-type beta-trefoil lectin domain protein n=1 Tax=Streptomyces sp. NPDC001027 TaxID=3154771 RepID=UPI003324616D
MHLFPICGYAVAGERLGLTDDTNSGLVLELIAQHRAPVLEYATLCTTSAQAAIALAGSAFRRGLDTSSERAWPWRSHLLSEVIDSAQRWDADGRRFDLSDGLRTGSDGREPPAVSLRRDRRLLLQAFRQLPDEQQLLLWHTEVEAEDLPLAASYAELRMETARSKLRQARCQLRTGCLQAHVDLARDPACSRYTRLIDVAVSRSQIAEPLPDLQQHFTECAYCRTAADQLDHGPGRLPLLLAEAVLGFRVKDYLALCRARSGASTAEPAAEPPPPDVTTSTPSVHVGMRRARRAARRRAGIRFGWMGAVLGTLAGVLTWILVGGSPHAPGTVADAVGAAPTRTTPAGNRLTPGAAVRFRNSGSGLCLDIAHQDPRAGTTVVTSSCAETPTQLWHLDADGLLRNHADPGLCLEFDRIFGHEVNPCIYAAGDGTRAFQYTLSDDGLLVLRRNRRLVVTPVGTDQAQGAPVALREANALFPYMFKRWRIESVTPY